LAIFDESALEKSHENLNEFAIFVSRMPDMLLDGQDVANMNPSFLQQLIASDVGFCFQFLLGSLLLSLKILKFKG
jgi:hypothetical protein